MGYPLSAIRYPLFRPESNTVGGSRTDRAERGWASRGLFGRAQTIFVRESQDLLDTCRTTTFRWFSPIFRARRRTLF